MNSAVNDCSLQDRKQEIGWEKEKAKKPFSTLY